MRIFIPSYNRTVPLPAAAYFRESGLALAVVVPESQLDGYHASHPGIEVVAVPDAVDGNVARKRNAILDMIRAEPDATGFMVDDDVTRLVRSRDPREADLLFSGKSAQEIDGLEAVPPSEAGEVMTQLLQKARTDGAVYFGFNNSRRYRDFDPAMPFATNRFFTAVLGFIGQSDMRFEESLARGSSIDFFLTHRSKVLRDNRYAPDRRRLDGGIDVSFQERKAHNRTLVNKWGAEVIQISAAGSAITRLNPEAVGA